MQSIGICYEGGISERGRLADTRTVWQKHSLRVLVRALLVDYPGCKVCGHRDLSPDLNGNGEIEPEEMTQEEQEHLSERQTIEELIRNKPAEMAMLVKTWLSED